MAKKLKLAQLKMPKDLFIRASLSEDAVQRYIEMFQSGKEKAIKVQADSFVVLDGWHRIEATKRLGLNDILADVLNVRDVDLRALAFEYNKTHGVPLTREERNKLIHKLYFEDGKTQQQIAKLMGLTERRIGQILETETTSDVNNNIEEGDKRRELTNKDRIVITKLVLAGEKQQEVARKFGVSQGRISQVWAETRDEIHNLYSDQGLLKREIVNKIGISCEEIDTVLVEYGDPLNFEQLTVTWWPAFGLDDRFGKKHTTNLPAGLVRNILALYTKPSDVIVDPAAGGGVVLDVAKDMVKRECYCFDLTPMRSDVKTYNLFSGSAPITPEKPDLIFLDLPYASQKQYSFDSDDLSNRNIAEYLNILSQIFQYWDSGILVVLMSSYRGKEGFVDLPFETEKRMEETGWHIIEHIVNEHGRKVASQKGFWVAKAKKDRWLLRKHVHILVGEK